jgi:hypothetical protein
MKQELQLKHDREIEELKGEIRDIRSLLNDLKEQLEALATRSTAPIAARVADSNPPPCIKVKGADNYYINGIYRLEGLCRYVMKGDGSRGRSFKIARKDSAFGTPQYWFVSPVSTALSTNKRPYYKAWVTAKCPNIPPCNEWKCVRSGLYGIAPSLEHQEHL